MQGKIAYLYSDKIYFKTKVSLKITAVTNKPIEIVIYVYIWISSFTKKKFIKNKISKIS